MISANVKADVNEMKYPIFFCKIQLQQGNLYDKKDKEKL